MKGKTLIKYISSHALAILPSYLEVIKTAVEEWPEDKLLKVAHTDTPAADNSVVNGVKVLSYSGSMMKKTSGMMALSGGISMQKVRSDIEAALLDDAIEGIVLSIDSPGGTVDGTKELADFIMEAKQVKPIVAYADGLMASAAYWVGSAADAVVAYDTTQVGSIGVIMTHFDYSEKAKEDKVNVTVMRAGKYKALANRYEPLSKEAKELLQADLDYYYSMFVDHVAAARGTDVKTVLDVMAEGRVFIGSKAKEAGLVDEIGGIEKAITLTLELGGKNVDKKVQEALVNGSLPDVLSTLAARDDLEESVKAAIEAAITPPEKVEIEKSVYDGLLAELKDTQAKLENTEAQLAEAQSTIKALQATTAKTEKENAIKAMFADTGYEINPELMETLLGMDEAAVQVVVDNIITAKAAMDEIAQSLLDEPAGSAEEPDTTIPQTMDDAVNAIMADNPDMGIEDAIAKASMEYPELFKRK